MTASGCNPSVPPSPRSRQTGGHHSVPVNLPEPWSTVTGMVINRYQRTHPSQQGRERPDGGGHPATGEAVILSKLA